MKTIASILIVSLLFGCGPEGATPNAPGSGVNVDLTNATLLKTGMFTGIGGHTASGTVKVYELGSKKYMQFDPYSSQNGPDLKVYLSKTATASEYIRVGNLLSTSGKQTYEVPGNPNIADYPFVHIWCEQFSVEFARAPLQ
jgi:Electron transfer DM13